MLHGRSGWLALLCLVVRGESRHTRQLQQGWGTRSPYRTARPGRNLDDYESLADFITRIRGGSDPYYGGDYRRGKGSSSYGYGDDYSQQDYYYGQDDDTNDDNDEDDDNYYGSSGANKAPRRRRNDYNDYYDDDRRRPSTLSGPDVGSIFKTLPSIIQNGDRRIGLGLLSIGAMITMLGISLFFNKTLMRLGNLLFIAGVPMMLGPSRTMGYFLKPEKFRATICLALGILLVLVGSPVFGIALEIFGLLNLFGNMFPVVMAIAKNMPVIGPILSGNNNNGNSNGNNRYSASRGNGSRGRYDDDPYYDDRGYDRDYDNDYYGDDNYSHDGYQGSYR